MDAVKICMGRTTGATEALSASSFLLKQFLYSPHPFKCIVGNSSNTLGASHTRALAFGVLVIVVPLADIVSPSPANVPVIHTLSGSHFYLQA